MAIPDILKYVAIEFDHYLEIRNDQPRGRFGYVNLGNIALVDEGSSGMGGEQDKVTMTLINIEEEATLKNRPNYQRERMMTLANAIEGGFPTQYVEKII